MSEYYSLLSFFPIFSLLIISIIRGVKAGIYVGLIISIILFFLSGSELLTFLAAVFSAFVGTLNILMIIFGAVLLYHVMEQKGYIEQIKDSLSNIHPSKNFRFFFLAIFLTAFFESVAGFGTPGAIVPLLLISMGYPAVLSIAVVLLIDGFFAISGAVGTPVIAGLELPLQLNLQSVSNIYLYSSIAILFCGVLVMAFIYHYIKVDSNYKIGGYGWVLYFTIFIPFTIASYFMLELTGIIAALFMAIFSYFFLFKNKQFNWRPWLPYLILVIILLIPKIFPWFAEFLGYKISFAEVLGTNVNASLQPFRSPLIPFVISALFALYLVKNYQINLQPVVSKTFAVFLVLFPSLAITQLMMNSGGENLPSMIVAIASVFVSAGDAYPLFSPFIGVIGSFITGSTTVSNIIFGPVQYNAAISLNFSPEIILGLQLAGASLGNAVCLFNIIAAAAVAGIEDYNAILKMNILPVIAGSLVVALVGYILMYII
jgi:lactate permease